MKRTELAIIGAGPAGLSAACQAARLGVQTLLIDEYTRPGGQLIKQIHKFFGSEAHKAGVRGIDIAAGFLKELEESPVEVMLGASVWSIFPNRVLSVAVDGRTQQIRAEKIILATGASENALGFPGWTLPGVMTAGAAQTSMNINRILPGKKVLMIGAGNVGVIISYQLLQAGAQEVTIIEAKDQIGAYQVHASKVKRLGVDILTGHTVKEVTGNGRVEKAVITAVDQRYQPVPGTERTLEVDLVCLACGLTPLSDLARLAGCRFTWSPLMGNYIPLVNDKMETTVDGVYVAGDCGGVEEASTAIEEGTVAAISAAESLGLVFAARAAQLRQEARQRLCDLRSGAFGEPRRLAKDALNEEYKAYERV